MKGCDDGRFWDKLLQPARLSGVMSGYMSWGQTWRLDCLYLALGLNKNTDASSSSAVRVSDQNDA